MDIKILEKEYLRLRDVLVENYSLHFNRYLIMDFHEADAEVDYKFDPLDEYLYLEEFSEEINQLLTSSYDLLDNNRVKEIQAELAGIKYTIDIKLFENPFKDGFSSESKEGKKLIKIEFFLNDIVCFIDGLREVLLNNLCIEEISKEDFQNNLINGEINKPIVWMEKQAMLGNLIDIIYKHKLLGGKTSKRRFNQISKHFKKVNGKPFKAKEITSSQSNNAIKENSVTAKKLEAIEQYVSSFSNK